MDNIDDFVIKFTERTFVQATLSKPRKFSPYKNIMIRPILLKEGKKYQVTYRTDTKDQVQNYSMEDLHIQLSMWLVQNFYFADLQTKKEDIRLMQSAKGKITITKKSAYNQAKSTDHNREKKRAIPESAPFLQGLGLSSTNGKVYNHSQKKFKQINKYIEIIDGLIDQDRMSRIVDMGSGKGYLTFALYEYLHEQNKSLQIEGVELRNDLVEKCNKIAEEINYQGLTFRQGSIEDTEVGNTDLVIALHACDIATDMAIAKGIQADAKYIAVAPCCHKQIRKAMQSTDTVLNPLLKHGILKERMAEMVTDTIRALLLESYGYKTKVFEFISVEHTHKNVMITAVNTGQKDKSALAKIAEIKKEFGIKEHYLETLL